MKTHKRKEKSFVKKIDQTAVHFIYRETVLPQAAGAAARRAKESYELALRSAREMAESAKVACRQYAFWTVKYKIAPLLQ